MIRVNSGDELAALMRVQIAALRRKADPQKPLNANPAAASPNARQKAATGDLASVAAQRIRGIQPDDPQRSQKAMRIFLESVLLAELGSSLIEDPEFGRMVDHVQRQLESNPELTRATQQATEVLLQAAAARG